MESSREADVGVLLFERSCPGRYTIGTTVRANFHELIGNTMTRRGPHRLPRGIAKELDRAIRATLDGFSAGIFRLRNQQNRHLKVHDLDGLAWRSLCCAA
jgi:hypothetical protein